MHEIVATCEAIEEPAAGKRVSSDDAAHEVIVPCYEVIPPACIRPVVVVRVRVVHPSLRDVCGTTMLAEQLCSGTVRQAMFNVHGEIVLVEKVDEFPKCAVWVFGEWDPVPVVAYCHKFGFIPPLSPCPSGCFSRFALLANVVVVHKPRLDVFAVDEEVAPIEEL